tara:strand:- start:235 stop:510 length:276 start_codon:yes stop_codon:yes gene_type:complete
LQRDTNEYVGRHGRIFIGLGENKKIFHYNASKWKPPFKIGNRKGLNFSREHCVLIYELRLWKILKHIIYMNCKIKIWVVGVTTVIFVMERF